MTDLLAALALVAVFEGLVLFAIPRGWKHAAVQLLRMPDTQLRWMGALILGAGLLVLWWARH